MSFRPSVALIGIDGGSWNVLEWLAREGHVPNLKRAINSGTHGALRSLIPPVTGSAWLSLATGLNPGKTGVIDFFKHVGNWVLKPVSADDFRCRSVWDFCSLHGLRVAVLDYPMLYPAYPINGIMVSSWGGEVSTYPPELVNEVEDVANGDYSIFVNYHREMYDDIDLFIEDLSKAVEKKLRVSKHFMKMPWDLFIDVLSYTDWLQHRMWHYIDPNHPWYPGDEQASRYKRKFAEFWQLLDEYIGEVIETYDVVFIVSDHGFGPQWGVFNLGRWVVEHSYAEIEKSVVRKVMKFLLRVIVKLKLHKAIPRRLRGKVKEHGLGLKAPLTVFDIEKSKVIVLGYTIPFGAIHVNPKHVTNIESFIAEFIEKLSESVKEIKSTLEVKVWKVKDLYHGEKTHYLPEVVFTINDWSCVIIKDPNEEFIYLDAPYSSRHTGSHRLHGVFVVHGEGISRGRRLDNVTILDVAPTILHILGVPIPSSMDGRVLTEIFNPSSVYAKIEPRYVDPSYYTRLKLATRIMHARKSGLRRRRIAREHM